MNPFTCLGLPLKLDISETGIREAYREQAARYHPDAGGDSSHFSEFGKAQEILLSPAKRLRAWALLHHQELEERGVIDAELMDLFSKIADLMQAAETILKESQLARSVLTQKLAELKRMELRESIQQEVKELDNHMERRISMFEAIASDFVMISQVYRSLVFLEKWRGSLRSLYGRLL